MQLESNPDNIGGQSLRTNKNDKNDNKYIETILFDDIIPYLPYYNEITKENYKKAILKIDIEGSEPEAFKNAFNLFSILDIRVIYMEWYNIKKLHELKVEELIDFFIKNDYRVYDNEVLLDLNKWLEWPFNVIWIKK